jgi:DNA-binding NarL/FixJ family response regulator
MEPNMTEVDAGPAATFECIPGIRRQLDLVEVLTPREAEVFGLLARGRTDRQIATAMIITPRTVRAHISSLYDKLHVSDRVTAGVIAYAAHRRSCHICQ